MVTLYKLRLTCKQYYISLCLPTDLCNPSLGTFLWLCRVTGYSNVNKMYRWALKCNHVMAMKTVFQYYTWEEIIRHNPVPWQHIEPDCDILVLKMVMENIKVLPKTVEDPLLINFVVANNVVCLEYIFQNFTIVRKNKCIIFAKQLNRTQIIEIIK